MQQVRQIGSTVMVQYTYDDLGRVKSIVRDNGAYTTYSYDTSDLNWSLFQNISPTVNFGMAYTPAGQVSNQTITSTGSNYSYSAPNSSQTYTANGLNQLVASGFTYDGRGNLTSDGSRNFAYDLGNHLT